MSVEFNEEENLEDEIFEIDKDAIWGYFQFLLDKIPDFQGFLRESERINQHRPFRPHNDPRCDLGVNLTLKNEDVLCYAFSLNHIFPRYMKEGCFSQGRAAKNIPSQCRYF